MTADYENVRDYIVSAVIAAWQSVGKVYVDRYQEECVVYDEVQLPTDHYDTALIRLESAELTDGTVTQDAYLLTWRIGGKFWAGANTANTGSQRVDRVSSLRYQLLASNTPGDSAYLPQVTMMDVSDDDDSLGDSYVAALTFTCIMELSR